MKYPNVQPRREDNDTNTMNMLLQSVINYAVTKPDPFGILTVNMNEVVTTITDEILHKNHHSNFHFTIIKELPVIQGISSSLMHQVFENLMENAIKFNNSDMPDVRISWSENNDEYTFSVSDNGIGISPINYRTLFDLFPNNISSRQSSRKSVGLMLCKKIVEHYGGRIWVESTLGKGSTFYFTISKLKQANDQKNDHVYLPFGLEDRRIIDQRNIA